MTFFGSFFSGKQKGQLLSCNDVVEKEGENGAATQSEDSPVSLVRPNVVSVETPLNGGGFRSDSPTTYGEGHIHLNGHGGETQSKGSEDGPGALHLDLPPLGTSHEGSQVVKGQPPIGSLGGESDDLYITHSRNGLGSATPDTLQAKMRAGELQSYHGEGNELQLPLDAGKQSIHPRSSDGGINHSI